MRLLRLIGLRMTVIVVLPICIAVAVLLRLIEALRSVPVYARSDIAEEWESSRRAWRGEGLESDQQMKQRASD